METKPSKLTDVSSEKENVSQSPLTNRVVAPMSELATSVADPVFHAAGVNV